VHLVAKKKVYRGSHKLNLRHVQLVCAMRRSWQAGPGGRSMYLRKGKSLEKQLDWANPTGNGFNKGAYHVHGRRKAGGGDPTGAGPSMNGMASNTTGKKFRAEGWESSGKSPYVRGLGDHKGRCPQTK